jgi:hypothetical protein
MSILSKAEILAADDLRTERVAVAEWNGEIVIRTMTGAQREQFLDHVAPDSDGKRSYKQFNASHVSLCAVDETGQPLFTLADAPAIAEKHWRALETVAEACLKLNALRADDLEEAKKNSSDDPNDASSLPLPEN